MNDNNSRIDERQRPPANLINAAELVQRQCHPRGWLLWQMIPRAGITLLAGETASGKTFLGLDLALGLASGRGRAWDMEFGEAPTSREWTPAIPHDANLKDPYAVHFVSQAQDDSTLCTERTPAASINNPRTERTPAAPIDNPRTERTLAAPIDDHLIHRPAVTPTRSLAGSTTLPHRGRLKEDRSASATPPAPSSPFPLPCEKVRYFCVDSDPNLIAERVARLCLGYPTPTCAGSAAKRTTGIAIPPNLDFDFSALQLIDPEDFTWLQKEIERKGYQLLIFDSLAQYLPAMADGSARAVGGFLRGLRQLASRTGVTILLIHQFNKRLPIKSDKLGIARSQGEERIRGTSELLAGVDTALLASKPDAALYGNRALVELLVVKNRLGQAGSSLRFSILDGEPTNADGVAHNTLYQGASEGLLKSLHLQFLPRSEKAPVQPRRLVDAAFDHFMKILMTQDGTKFDRRELTKLLKDRMTVPGSTTLSIAFNLLGKDERVKVERDKTGKKLYVWANPGTGEHENITYGLPRLYGFDLLGRYILTKAQVRLVEHQVDQMMGKDKNSELMERLAAFIKEQEAKEKKADGW